MTYTELAQVVADYFNEAMAEGEFNTFKEMCDCYWWDTKAIKEEVDAVIMMATNGDACIDAVDGTDVCLGGDLLSYRKFSNMWHKLLNNKEVK